MSEEELRRALSALERKVDDIRAEVVTALREFKQGNKGSHAEFYRRILALELECAARKHAVESALEHARTDESTEGVFLSQGFGDSRICGGGRFGGYRRGDCGVVRVVEWSVGYDGGFERCFCANGR